MPPPANQRRVYLYTGRVQGVGFRYTARNIAMKYKVAGYVKNLPDGRVELCAEGPAGELDALVEEVGQKMAGFIKSVTVREEPVRHDAPAFSIRH